MTNKIKINYTFNPYFNPQAVTKASSPSIPKPKPNSKISPAVTTPKIPNASPIFPYTGLLQSQRAVQQLEEFKGLLKDASKTNNDLIAKYEQLAPHLKESLSKLVWICHYKPNEYGFGERILKENMRALLDIQNSDHVDIVSQLTSHYSNKIQAHELAVEINNFIIGAGKFSTDKNALLRFFNTLSDKAKNDLRYKVWYNHGGSMDPNFGGWDYGTKKIVENPYFLWENFKGSSSSLAMSYLAELEQKKNCDDNAFIEELSKSHTLNRLFDSSTSSLENEEGLIKTLPKHLRTAYVTAELAKVASIGGLASALDGIVRGFGEDDARVIMPLYENGPIKDAIMNNLVETDYEIFAEGRQLKILKPNKETRENVLKGLHVYFIADPTLFWIPKKEDGTAGNFYEGNYHYTRRRWSVFQKGAADLCYQFSKKNNPFELVHVHDSQTALVPKFIKEQHLDEWKRGETPATVFTYHNNQEAMEYTDNQNVAQLASVGLPRKGMNSFIEGLHDSDVVTTVSKQFAKESQWEHSDFGKGMQREVRHIAAQGKLFGIVNGNSNDWNPAASKQLKKWISVLPATLGTKLNLRFGPHMTDQELADNTKTIQREICAYLKQLDPTHPAYVDLDPEKPIVLFINRYDSSQKGTEKLKLMMDETLAKGGQFVCVGIEPDSRAKETLHEMKAIARKRNHKGVLILEDRKENGALVHQGVFGDMLRAACTLFAVPSKFEPCGLVHSELLRYGKKIIATKTGGLIDTLKTEGPDANAYLFERKPFWGSRENPSWEQNEAIKSTLHKALDDAHKQQRALYHGTPEEISHYTGQMRHIMNDALDSTWENTTDGSLSAIRLYELAYAKAFQKRKLRGKIHANLNTLKI